MQTQGCLIWITGLSGSGKTSVATRLTAYLQTQNFHPIHLDGDELRKIFGKSYGYDLGQRKILAMQYCHLCQLLVLQNHWVICSCVALHHEVHQFNRENNQNYLEVLLQVPMTELVKRDQKQLYSKGLAGEISHVMGVDLEPDFPSNPDSIIQNFAEITVTKSTNKIIDLLNQKFKLALPQYVK